MKYRVGETITPCFATATLKADEAKAPVVFLVGDKTYESREAASVALEKVLNEKIEGLTAMRFVAGSETYNCPMTAGKAAKAAKTEMHYSVAGIEFDDKNKARAAAEQASKVAATVSMKYKADDGKPVSCCKSAKAAGRAITYTVGDKETSSETSAKLYVAEEKIRQIVETVAGASL